MSAYPVKPSYVATLESELLRLLLAYQEVNPKTILNEDVNTPEPVGQWWIRQTPAGQVVFIGRCTIILNRETLNTDAKLWRSASEMPGGAVVPSQYTT